MLNRKLVVMLIAVTAMINLVACNSNQVSQAPVENKEDVVVSTESITTEQSTEIESTEQEETIWISLTEEQITGETKPIEYSISYFSLSNEYRAKAEEIFENYIASGMEEEQAVEQAITDILDKVYEEYDTYLSELYLQEEETGTEIVYDENGYDKALYKWYATDEQEVIDLGAFYVKSGEMTKSEAEQYINDTLQGLAEFYEQENGNGTTDYSALDTAKNMTKNPDGTYEFSEEFIEELLKYPYFEGSTDEDLKEFFAWFGLLVDGATGEEVNWVFENMFADGNLHEENEANRKQQAASSNVNNSGTNSNNSSKSSSSNNSNASNNTPAPEYNQAPEEIDSSADLRPDPSIWGDVDTTPTGGGGRLETGATIGTP